MCTKKLAFFRAYKERSSFKGLIISVHISWGIVTGSCCCCTPRITSKSRRRGRISRGAGIRWSWRRRWRGGFLAGRLVSWIGTATIATWDFQSSWNGKQAWPVVSSLNPRPVSLHFERTKWVGNLALATAQLTVCRNAQLLTLLSGGISDWENLIFAMLVKMTRII